MPERLGHRESRLHSGLNVLLCVDVQMALQDSTEFGNLSASGGGIGWVLTADVGLFWLQFGRRRGIIRLALARLLYHSS